MRTCTRCLNDFWREPGPSMCTSCLLETGNVDCVKCGGKIERRSSLVCNACIKPAEPEPVWVKTVLEKQRHRTYGPDYGRNG